MFRLKKISSLFLLVVFSFVIFPKDWLHDCDHSEEINSSSIQFSEYSEEDCEICAYHFSSFGQDNNSLTFSVFSWEELTVSPEISSVFAISHGLIPGRAPPLV